MLCKNNKRFNSAVAWLDKKLLYNCLLRYTVTAYLKLAVVGVVKLKALSSLKGSPFTALGQIIIFTLRCSTMNANVSLFGGGSLDIA